MGMRPIMRPVMRPIMRGVLGPEVPVALWDFTKGKAYPELTFGNAVAGAISRDSLVFVPSGQARSSDLGLLCEKQSTNKCTNTNLKPTDTTGTTAQPAWTTWEVLTRASLPTAVRSGLEAIDPQGNVTHVYHGISNGVGSVFVDGAVGNTNTHTASVFQYVVSGNLGPTTQGTPHPVYGPEGWVRREMTTTPINGAVGLSVVAGVASEVYWFGNQLEERAGRSSLIEVNGAAATRLGDDVSTSISGVDPASFTVVVEYSKFLEPVSPNPDRALVLTGTPSLQDVVLSTTNVSSLTDLVVSIDGPVYVLGTIVRRAWGNDGTTRRAATGGALDGSAATTPPGEYTSIQFGVVSGSIRQIDGYIRGAAIYDLPATQSAVERLSA